MKRVTTLTGLFCLLFFIGLAPRTSAQCFQTTNGFSAELLVDGANSDGTYTYVWDVGFTSENRWISDIWFQTNGSQVTSVTVRPEYTTWQDSQVAMAPGTNAPAIRFEFVSGYKLQRNRTFTFAYTSEFQDPVRVTGRDSNGMMHDLNFTSASCGNLPVELTSFDVRADGAAAVVAWQTASETNNAGFSVEMRGQEALAYTTLGFVAGQGTTAEAQHYAFRTEALAPGRYVFRLKQVDFDGTTAFSAPFELELAPDEALYVRPFANTIRTGTTLAFSTQRAERMQVQVYNALGQQVASLFEGVVGQGELVETYFDAASLPSGVYFLRIAGETSRRTERVVVLE